ncbi:hypothetical protein SAY87_029031 [Trapa incisa]|uniref:Uncharacterized protein n=1 Tax=Trapa incisa TaxID=236973 RepID=A0AAN7KV49_9MYRT|nr:hypothetical protein SAY87_029031 [Trapa incisa]
MGNSASSNPSCRPGKGKVILSDGTVQELEAITTMTAAELMLEHPRQVVVEFESAISGKRPRPLPADEKLEPGKAYLMLPVKRGKPASLSADETRRVLLIASSAIRSRNSWGLVSYWGVFPLLARVCTNGLPGDERRHPHIHPKKRGQGEGTNMEGNGETIKAAAVVGRGRLVQLEFDLQQEVLEGQPEYLSRQLSGRGWKPSLDTIVEKKIDNRVSHWLF